MSAVLEVRDLSFGFDQRKPVLRDISFSVSAGESVGILGANGAGKSTLLWCVLGLYRARGTVRLFGGKPNRSSLDRTGVVLQNPEDLLFMPKLIDDLMLPLLNRGVNRAQALDTARDALRRMGLEGCEDAPASHLSLGQRKRAAIAAALVSSPELLILDEPTAELDGRSVRRLAELLSGMPGTRLITSHGLQFLRRVTTRLLVLHEGAVVAEGATEYVLADSMLLERTGLI